MRAQHPQPPEAGPLPVAVNELRFQPGASGYEAVGPYAMLWVTTSAPAGVPPAPGPSICCVYGGQPPLLRRVSKGGLGRHRTALWSCPHYVTVRPTVLNPPG